MEDERADGEKKEKNVNAIIPEVTEVRCAAARILAPSPR